MPNCRYCDGVLTTAERRTWCPNPDCPGNVGVPMPTMPTTSDPMPENLNVFAEEHDGKLFVNLWLPRPMRSKVAPDKTVTVIGLNDLNVSRETLFRNIGEIAVAVGRGDEELPY